MIVINNNLKLRNLQIIKQKNIFAIWIKTIILTAYNYKKLNYNKIFYKNIIKHII